MLDSQKKERKRKKKERKTFSSTAVQMDTYMRASVTYLIPDI